MPLAQQGNHAGGRDQHGGGHLARGGPTVPAVARPRHHRGCHRDAHAEQQQRWRVAPEPGRAYPGGAQREMASVPSTAIPRNMAITISTY